MVCSNKKGLATGTIVILILILVSFLVLVVFVTNLSGFASETGDRWICKLSILMDKFNCKTFKAELVNEQEVADKITDAWTTFFSGKRNVMVRFFGSPFQINCFDYMRFKVKKETNIEDINKILNEDKYKKIIDKSNFEFLGLFNKLKPEDEYVITLREEYNLKLGLTTVYGVVPVLPGERVSKIVIAPSKDIVTLAGCKYIYKGI